MYHALNFLDFDTLKVFYGFFLHLRLVGKDNWGRFFVSGRGRCISLLAAILNILIVFLIGFGEAIFFSELHLIHLFFVLVRLVGNF